MAPGVRPNRGGSVTYAVLRDRARAEPAPGVVRITLNAEGSRSFMESGPTAIVIRPPNVLGVSCTAGPACRSRSGAAVAAEELRSHDWRTATAVTPSRWRQRRQLCCRTEAGPCQLH